MASPAPGEQNSSVQTGQKRKREDDDSEIQNEVKNEVKSEIKGEDAEAEADGGANVDTNTLVPNDYEPDEDDENENDSNDEDDDDENTAEDNANHPKHQESDEPFPACAYYDEAIEDVEEQLTSIAERVQALLEDHNSSSKVLVAHKRKANELSDMPPTEKMRIAILGGAGAGKSSLLNAVTGKPDLAKSVSIRPVICWCEYANFSTAQWRTKLHMRADRVSRQFPETEM
jgi:ABC-type glutathione transport system ATPase component